MTTLEILTQVASRTNKNVADTNVKARLLAHVNNECQEQWEGFPWSFRAREYSTTLTSGTNAVTLPSEVWDVSEIYDTTYGTSIPLVAPRQAPTYPSSLTTTGGPLWAYIKGSDVAGSTYSTGTVTGTINTRILTGSATEWLTNVYPGDEITVLTNKYTVYSVDSDTSLTLYNHLVVACLGASYTASRKFQRQLYVFPQANQNYTLTIKGLRKYAPLVNDNDVNEMLVRYPVQVIEGAVRREMSSSPDSREMNTLKVTQMMWMNARAEDQSMTDIVQVNPIFRIR